MGNYNLTDPSAAEDNGTAFHNATTYAFEYSNDIYHILVNNPGEYNGTLFSPVHYPYKEGLAFYQYILYTFFILICIFGMLGNGMVIWLLGFRIKRNNFTTYVLNLAVADFGFLTTALVGKIIYFLLLATNSLYFSMFSTSQYLLTVISMDRCVSAFFPLWHRCHRPAKLSSFVCALIWTISFLPHAISLIIFRNWLSYHVILFQLTVNGFFCLPLLTISSLLLFIKICCKSKQQRRKKLLITILVTVFFFCFLCFPFNIIYMVYFFFRWEFVYFMPAMLGACLNSSVNPLIYYLVGRRKKGRSKKSMKAALQKLFKEEEI